MIPSRRHAIMSSCHHVIMPLRISYRQNNQEKKSKEQNRDTVLFAPPQYIVNVCFNVRS